MGASWAPVAKVKGGGVAGAASVVVLYVLEEFAHLQLPGLVQAAIGVLVTAGVAYVVPGGDKAPAEDQAVDERPLTVDERQQVVETVDWFTARQGKQQNGG
jgi:hypothetical protein